MATDVNGEFLVAGVHAPYDVLIATGAGGDGNVFMAKGLSRVDPVIRFIGNGNWPRHGTSSTTPTGPLPGATDRIASAWAGDVPAVGFGRCDGSDFEIDVSWSGPETTRGTAHVLTYSMPAGEDYGLPISYGVFGSVPTTVSSDPAGSPGGGTLALSPVTSVALTGTLDLPSGYVPNWHWLSVIFSDGAQISLEGEGSDGGTSFTDLVPMLPDSSMRIDAVAWEHLGGGLSEVTWTGPASESPVLRFVRPPTLLEPSAEAQQVPADAELSWADPTPGVSVADVTCSSPSSRSTLRMVLVTAGNSVRLPDLGVVGLTFPVGGACSWMVFRSPAPSDVDSYLGLPRNPAVRSAQAWGYSGPRVFYSR